MRGLRNVVFDGQVTDNGRPKKLKLKLDLKLKSVVSLAQNLAFFAVKKAES